MRDSTNEVLRAIATYGPVSRAQLARDLGLSGPTLTQATKYLFDRGLVTEVEQSPSTGGRPATLLGLVANAGQVLGVKLAEDHAVGVCVNLQSEILWSFEEPFSSRGDDAVKELTQLLRKQTKLIKGQLLGIGIGIPGVVSPLDSSTADSAMLSWNKINVGKQISDALNTPVLLENDVNTLAITESLYGHGRDVSNFLTITLGRGIGMGLVINGELYAGSYGAGEFGHVNAISGGPECECGKYGCLEVIASSPAIHAAALAAGYISRSASMTKLWNIARKDKKIANDLFKKPAELLGIALANVINVFGPELIFISGEGVEGWDLWEETFKKSLYANVVPTMNKFDIEVDPWDDAKWALGATAIVLQASLSRSQSTNASSTEVKNRLRIATKSESRVS
ncbi:MAG: ROK family transcriptional regulator [Actinobacteria bacterium]|nr:ROK family transcriptional regulator [Actinomycetota bacterium]